MGIYRNICRGLARASLGAVCAGILASCGGGPSGPAPVYLKGGAQGAGWSGPTAMMPRPSGPTLAGPPVAGPPSAGPRTIIVQRGQSLGGVAHSYHVPERAIIEANNLRPPYQLTVGSRLVIPGTRNAPAQQAAMPLPSRPPAEGPPASSHQPAIVPLDTPEPPRSVAAAPPPTPARPGPATLTPPPSTNMVVPRPPEGEPSVAEEARAEPPAQSANPPPANASGRFAWPVRGRVLAGYGASSGGARNDGINIAAPRGAPVKAIEAGEVAYAGNELRGYGNLVLVKHADGWISAYAHCDELLVRKGEKVRPGQVIAKVGATGGVNEPQLHFELRRGQKPVDPREFLAPAPSAGAPPPGAG